MHKPLLILLGILILTLGGGSLLIKTNPAIRKIAENIGIVPPPTPAAIPYSSNAVFIIGDGSGSGKTTYSVPKITVPFIDQVIRRIQSSGQGEIWLTFIDMNASNNQVLHFTIPAEGKTLSAPTPNAAERKAEFDKRMAQFRKDSITLQKELEMSIGRFEEDKHRFLADCQKLIVEAYSPKRSGTDYSDVIGCLNAGYRSLETVDHDSTHYRSVLVVSDGVQTYHSSTPKSELMEFSKDISLFVVNHAGSKGSVLEGKAIEVDNLDRALDKVIQAYNR